MDIHAILQAVYEIQGAADPNHDNRKGKTDVRLCDYQRRMKEIWERACDVMDRTGFQPND